MIEKIKDWLDFSKNKNGAKLAIALGLLGMFLILLSEFYAQPKEQKIVQKVKDEERQTLNYKENLEQQLEQLISQLDGAGKAVVMVTLAGGEEFVYAKDEESTGQQNVKEHVLLENGTALAETVLLPKVSGIAVLCEGGGDITVEVKITEMLTALFRLPTNYISVEKMNTEDYT